MQLWKKSTVLTAIALGAALAATACDQRPETVGQKADQAASNLARNANEAAGRAADTMDDAAITTKVKAAILAEPGLRSLDIGVTTTDAVVTLTGRVASLELKDRAKQVAAGVDGVRSVTDNLQAEPTG